MDTGPPPYPNAVSVYQAEASNIQLKHSQRGWMRYPAPIRRKALLLESGEILRDGISWFPLDVYPAVQVQLLVRHANLEPSLPLLTCLEKISCRYERFSLDHLFYRSANAWLPEHGAIYPPSLSMATLEEL
jgi:hypothetical protein